MSADLRYAMWKQEDVLDLEQLTKRIAAGADVNQPLGPVASDVPMGVAARHANVEACRMLLEAGADPQVGQQGDVPVFCVVIDQRDTSRAIVKSFLSQNGPVVSDRNMESIFELLVQYGAPLDGKEDDLGVDAGGCPLFQAANLGDCAAVTLLARLGANLNVVCQEFVSGDLKSISPVEAARDRGHDGVVELMLRLGADDEVLAQHELTPFQVCVQLGLDKAVEYYVRERGEDPAQRTGKGRTLARLARNDSTRSLLRALKTEVAIQDAVDAQGSEDQTDSPAKKDKGVSPL